MKKASRGSGHFHRVHGFVRHATKISTSLPCRFTLYMSFDFKFEHAELQSPFARIHIIDQLLRESHSKPMTLAEICDEVNARILEDNESMMDEVSLRTIRRGHRKDEK